jgi:hypothetical protein
MFEGKPMLIVPFFGKLVMCHVVGGGDVVHACHDLLVPLVPLLEVTISRARPHRPSSVMCHSLPPVQHSCQPQQQQQQQSHCDGSSFQIATQEVLPAVNDHRMQHASINWIPRCAFH